MQHWILPAEKAKCISINAVPFRKRTCLHYVYTNELTTCILDPTQKSPFLRRVRKMAPLHPPSADSRNSFEDLSGVTPLASSNPYEALILASADDPVGGDRHNYLDYSLIELDSNSGPL